MTRMPAGSTERELIEDPLEVRRMLEPYVAALAAARADEEAIREIRAWCDLIDTSEDSAESTVEYDSAFHIAVARATGNRTLVELVATLTDRLRPSRELSFRPADATRRAQDDHRAILDAIQGHDSVGAENAMRLHLDHVERLIRSTLQL